RLRAAFTLATANALRGALDPLANTLRLLRGVGVTLFLLALGGGVVLAAHEFDVGDFSRVATTIAHAQDTGVPARPIREPGRQRLEQLADDVGVGQFGEHHAP